MPVLLFEWALEIARYLEYSQLVMRISVRSIWRSGYELLEQLFHMDSGYESLKSQLSFLCPHSNQLS